MQAQTEAKTSWTDEEVKEIVSSLVLKRYGLDFDTYVRMVQKDDVAIDKCRDIDILGLLALTGVNSRNCESPR